MSEGITIQRQFQIAQLLQSLMLVLGVLFLGAGAGFFMALRAVANTSCGNALTSPEVCGSIIPVLNNGLLWGIVAGGMALLASAMMSYALSRVEL